MYFSLAITRVMLHIRTKVTGRDLLCQTDFWQSITYCNMNRLSNSASTFQELDQAACRRISGGAAWYIPVVVGGLLYQVLSHWDHFKQGLSGSPEQPEK